MAFKAETAELYAKCCYLSEIPCNTINVATYDEQIKVAGEKILQQLCFMNKGDFFV